MKCALTILFVMLCNAVTSQTVIDEYSNSIVTEDNRDKDEENDHDDDYELQQLEYYRRHPININRDEVERLAILDRMLVISLYRYRKLLGDLIDLHELLAVPGFTIDVIRKILPFVTVDVNALTKINRHDRLTNGDHTILFRMSFIPEKAKGFSLADTLASSFAGGRLATLIRYKYQHKNLQYGFLFDKDAGETLLGKNHLPQFITFHLFMRQAGIFKSIAIGDFVVNMGQGLVQWQSQAFGKSSTVINVNRQSDVVRPYNSAGEYNFNRGAGCSFQVLRSEITIFASKRNLSANLSDNAITSIITTGLHRTAAEIKDRNTANIFTAGATIKKHINSGSMGFNFIHGSYSMSVSKRKEPYTIYALDGSSWSNYSIDYRYTYKNFHFFGEVATDKHLNAAMISGALVSLGQKTDLSILYRHINKAYQAVNGNAFTENTSPSNEEGFYFGLSLKPHLQWQIDMYADVFSFPWLKYRLDAPAVGSAYLIQISFRPARHIELYTQVRTRLKPLNVEEPGISFPDINTLNNWRTHLSVQVSRAFTIRSRLELSKFSNSSLELPHYGYLFYSELFIKPSRSRFSGNMRFQVFEADSYDARIYAYESDLLFVSSIPSYYNNGVRYYINVQAKCKLKYLRGSELVIGLKASSTVYTNVSVTGTGPSTIPGNRSSTVKLQFFLSF